MRSLASELRNAMKKIRAAPYSKERALALSEADVIIEKVIKELERGVADTKCGSEEVLKRLLASVAKGVNFPGRKWYVNHDKEFDAVIDEVEKKVGTVEEVSLQSTGRSR